MKITFEFLAALLIVVILIVTAGVLLMTFVDYVVYCQSYIGAATVPERCVMP